MRGDYGELRNHLVELAEFGDDLIGENGIIIRVAQQERFAHAILEAALFIDGIANVEETAVGVKIHKDANAARGMTA